MVRRRVIDLLAALALVCLFSSSCFGQALGGEYPAFGVFIADIVSGLTGEDVQVNSLGVGVAASGTSGETDTKVAVQIGSSSTINSTRSTYGRVDYEDAAELFSFRSDDSLANVRASSHFAPGSYYGSTSAVPAPLLQGATIGDGTGIGIDDDVDGLTLNTVTSGGASSSQMTITSSVVHIAEGNGTINAKAAGFVALTATSDKLTLRTEADNASFEAKNITASAWVSAPIAYCNDYLDSAGTGPAPFSLGLSVAAEGVVNIGKSTGIVNSVDANHVALSAFGNQVYCRTNSGGAAFSASIIEAITKVDAPSVESGDYVDRAGTGPAPFSLGGNYKEGAYPGIPSSGCTIYTSSADSVPNVWGVNSDGSAAKVGMIFPSFTPIDNTDSPYTVLGTTTYLQVVASAGNVVINLDPDRSEPVYIKAITAPGANTITLQMTSGNIDGAASNTTALTAIWDSVQVVGDGTDGFIY